MSTRKSAEPAPQPNPARRALLTGGAVGLAAVAGATLGGAQPASADTAPVQWITPSGVAGTDTKAIQDALNSPGVALLAPGTFLINKTLTVPVPTEPSNGEPLVPRGSLIGSGHGTTMLMFSGSGPAVKAHGTADLGTTMAQGNGARIMHLAIDGTGVSSTDTQSSGLDVGDQADLLIWGVMIQNFTNTAATGPGGSNPLGAVGLNINNQTTWTEKYKVWVMTNNCTNAVQLVTTTGNSSSHMYGDLEMHVNANTYTNAQSIENTQNGLVIASQGHLMNGRLIMRGNFINASGTTNSGAAIVLGVPTQQGHIESMYVDVHVESDGTGTPPTTILGGGATDNVMKACHGRLQFKDGWQNSNLNPQTPGTFVFFGPIIGDSQLSGVSANPPMYGLPAIATGTPIVYAIGQITNDTSNNTSPVSSNGDMFSLVLNQNTTIGLNADGGVGGPRRITLVISQPEGNNNSYTVSWPSNLSPTLSSPTVKWENGTKPSMSTGPGATNVYYLETLDGITWYGRWTMKVS